MSEDTKNEAAENVQPEKEKKSFRIPGHWYAIVAFILVFGLFIGFTVAFRDSVSGSAYRAPTGLSKQEMTTLVKSLGPMQQKALSENPEQRKQLAEEIKRILSMARQAEREGVTADENVQNELKFAKIAVTANNYDQKFNKPEGPQAGPFSSVSEEKIKAFWEGKDSEGADSGVLAAEREKEFQQFIDGKIAIAKTAGQIPEDMKPSEEELKMAKDIFAKSKIVYREVEEKLAGAAKLPEKEKQELKEFEEETDLQVKLQQAQFLAQYYSQNVLAKKLEVTDEDIAKYIKDNPELGDAGKKKARADEVLKKVLDGGDFAELAKEYSEDPGSKESGGLYEGVKLGQMNPDFEKAALALEPGAVAENLVKTDFGFHVIKLESKTEGKDAEYAVRHILISTQISDPNNPMGRPMPVDAFVKSKLTSEKQERVLKEILENNPVSVPVDYEIPEVSEEELKKLLEQRQQMVPQQGPPRPPNPQP